MVSDTTLATNICIQTRNVFIQVIYQSISRILQATELCFLLSP